MSDLASLPYRPAAGIMLLNAENKVFVGQRLDSTLEAWQMPQGGIDEGEGEEEAALRELEEETGIVRSLVTVIARSRDYHYYDLPDDLVGKVWKGRYRGQRQSWFVMRFNGGDQDVAIETSEPEFRAWKWADPAELAELIVPFKRDLYAAVVEEFRPHWSGA